MNRTRISASLSALLLASMVPMAAQQFAKEAAITAKEPAGVKGYVTWTDPASGKKHLVTGMAQNTQTGAWDQPIIADFGPILQVSFTAATAGLAPAQITVDYSNDAYTLDATGKRLSYRLLADYRLNNGQRVSYLRWSDSENPAAFRYDIRFTHDLAYMGQPLLEPKIISTVGAAQVLPPESNYFRVIRYNPNRHHFADIKVKTDQIFQRPQITVNMLDFLINPPTQPRRATPFADLPAF